MSSSLPPSPGGRPPTVGAAVDELADRLGTSVPAVAAGAALVVVALVGAVFVWVRDDAPPPELTIPFAGADSTAAGTPPATATTMTVAAEVTVHVAGAVAHPGVYVVGGDARVGDTVAAAGGPAEGADLDRLNLAAPVADGSRIYVPLHGETDLPGVLGPDIGASTAPGTTAEGLVDINRADAATLESLPGVGPSTATAIVDHREANGPFRTVDDLLGVRGIGEAKLAALRDQVTVDGG